jgi:hypothetical protein
MYSISTSLTIGTGTAYTSGSSVTVNVGLSMGIGIGNVIAFYPPTLTAVNQVYYRVVIGKPTATSITVDRVIDLGASSSFKYAYAPYFPFTGTSLGGGVKEVKKSFASKNTVLSNPGLPSYQAQYMDYIDNPTQTITVTGLYSGTPLQLGNFEVNIHNMIDGNQTTRNACLYTSDVPDLATFVIINKFTMTTNVESASGQPLGSAPFELILDESRILPV